MLSFILTQPPETWFPRASICPDSAHRLHYKTQVLYPDSHGNSLERNDGSITYYTEGQDEDLKVIGDISRNEKLDVNTLFDFVQDSF